MNPIAFIAVLTWAIGMAPARAAAPLELAQGMMNEINVTTDSSRGWIPTAEQRQGVLKTLEMFLDAVEAERYGEAYEMQTEIMKRHQTLSEFTGDAQGFRTMGGPQNSGRS